MKRKRLLISVLLLLFVMGISTICLAEEIEGEPMGSFKIAPPPKSINIKTDEYVPMNEVASTIGFDFEWSFRQGKVEGNFGNASFSSDNFIIAEGKLYLPINIISDIFGLHIEIRGNNYYVYGRYTHFYGVDLFLQTNARTSSRRDPLAVSLLLTNESNRPVDLRYTSSKKYDLVLKRYNREVWRLSEGKGFLTVMSSDRLAPGEYKLYTELIDPSKDSFIPRGDYELYAEITTSRGAITSNVINLRLE